MSVLDSPRWVLYSRGMEDFRLTTEGWQRLVDRLDALAVEMEAAERRVRWMWYLIGALVVAAVVGWLR